MRMDVPGAAKTCTSPSTSICCTSSCTSTCTCTRESVEALRRVLEGVGTMVEEVEVTSLRSSLAQYQAAGPALAPIVQEFAR